MGGNFGQERSLLTEHAVAGNCRLCRSRGEGRWHVGEEVTGVNG
jgi:hypothetical protein